MVAPNTTYRCAASCVKSDTDKEERLIILLDPSLPLSPSPPGEVEEDDDEEEDFDLTKPPIPSTFCWMIPSSQAVSILLSIKSCNSINRENNPLSCQDHIPSCLFSVDTGGKQMSKLGISKFMNTATGIHTKIAPDIGCTTKIQFLNAATR
eukprot:CAMPEP_0170969214 /NCGR_PEP_ID=MMETSP0735-20130129/43809_1 /TAXON_ID=186038 /ORGANISM="Fragilariopsis kerguelensis, Strain L26-C5" /LENGTH=150 /DNA_ID=CAMNT_0011388569 /DNA_START=211 /DNA_END=661 /DNA_ORIENTATION=-